MWRFAVLGVLLVGCSDAAVEVPSEPTALAPRDVVLVLSEEAEPWRAHLESGAVQWGLATGRTVRVGYRGRALEEGDVPVGIVEPQGGGLARGGPRVINFARGVTPTRVIAWHELGHVMGGDRPTPHTAQGKHVLAPAPPSRGILERRGPFLPDEEQEAKDLGMRYQDSDPPQYTDEERTVWQAVWEPTCIDEESATLAGGASTCAAP